MTSITAPHSGGVSLDEPLKAANEELEDLHVRPPELRRPRAAASISLAQGTDGIVVFGLSHHV
jgi:hypothetical protein